ncbi:MAG: hypothetical protein PUK22_04775 [Bacteroides sp.]|nr:hypothetical protein [Bacteroides sp.]
MAWTEIRERHSEMGMGKVRELLAETKENLEMLCEIVEEMEGDDYGERGGYVNRRGDGGSSVGMRRGYRIYQDDDEFGERRRRDSRGRYM